MNTTETWLVKAPGEHSKTNYRVVRDCGINAVGGQPVFAAICEINTSRTSEDGYSDATEQKRAESIATDHNEREALRACAEALVKLWAHYRDIAKSNPGFMGKLALQDYALYNEAMGKAPKALNALAAIRNQGTK